MTFLKRAILGPQHYPTRTTIESLRIGRRDVDPNDPAATKILVTYNQRVAFEITCSGDYPPPEAADDEAAERDWNSGVQLVGLKSGTRHWLPFSPVEGREGVFRAEWEGASEPVRFQVFAGWAWAERPWLRPVGLMLGRRRGKAWTDSAVLGVTDPLKIEAELEVARARLRAAGLGSTRMPSGLRQIAVDEGSRVVVRLFSSKPLKKASVALREIDPQTGKPGAAKTLAFRPEEKDANGDNGKQADTRDRWVLDLPDTPLAAVFKPLGILGRRARHRRPDARRADRRHDPHPQRRTAADRLHLPHAARGADRRAHDLLRRQRAIRRGQRDGARVP